MEQNIDHIDDETKRQFKALIKLNYQHLYKNYRLGDKDMDTLDRNWWKLYDTFIYQSRVPENFVLRGNILMYLRYKNSEDIINQFRECEKKYLDKGYKQKDIKYSIIDYTSKDIEILLEDFFGGDGNEQ